MYRNIRNMIIGINEEDTCMRNKQYRQALLTTFGLVESYLVARTHACARNNIDRHY